MTRFIEGKIVVGTVTGIEKYGIFVNLDEYYSGLIHISEVSDNFVRNINDYVTLGETIRVKILEVDNSTSHLKLSIKGIDYRVNKRQKTKIVETKKGFSSLERMMKKWITDKESELNYKKV